MHDQQHDNVGVPKDRAAFQMSEASLQTPLQIQPRQQRLHDNQPGEGGQMLVLEANLRQRTGFQINRILANLHSNGLSCWHGCFSQLNYTNAEAVFISSSNIQKTFRVFSKLTRGEI